MLGLHRLIVDTDARGFHRLLNDGQHGGFLTWQGDRVLDGILEIVTHLRRGRCRGYAARQVQSFFLFLSLLTQGAETSSVTSLSFRRRWGRRESESSSALFILRFLGVSAGRL